MAPPKRPWFRFYVEAVADVKLRRQKPETRWLFVAMLAAARQSCLPGFLLLSEKVPMSWDDLADYAGLTRRQVETGTDALQDVGIVGFDAALGAWFITKWDDRQFESDDSSERVARHRKGVDVTPHSRSSNDDVRDDVTPPETEDREQSQRGGARAQHHDLLRPDAAPLLLEEVDQIVGVLVHVHGDVAVSEAVQQLIDQRLRFSFPSKARAALEAILGQPGAAARPSPLDDTARAQAAAFERNRRRLAGEVDCAKCEDVGVLEQEDGSYADCECKYRRTA